MALTEKQKAFCREYFINGGNGTQAYLTAYDSNSEVSASVEASRLLARDDIREYLDSLNKPCEEKAQSERERKRAILWEFITDSNTPNADRLRAMDILNRMDAEYVNINRNIDDGKPDISNIDIDKLKQLAGV
jgi:phage terminase small subunit